MIKLPTEIQQPEFDINKITMIIYGQPKIGKSTFCSRFENALFMATEPGLNYLKTYNVRVSNWQDACELVSLLDRERHPYKILIIDTIDILWTLCGEHIRKQRGVEVLSDISYGKGKDLLFTFFLDFIAKVARLQMGLIFVSHAKMTEIENEQGKLSKCLPTIHERVREIIFPMVDIIGFATTETVYTQDGEKIERRILRTQPSSMWEAGDRTGRLKDPMPLKFQIFKNLYLGESPQQ